MKYHLKNLREVTNDYLTQTKKRYTIAIRAWLC